MDKYIILLSENERRLNGWILCQDQSHLGLSLSQGILVDIFVCLLLPIIGEKKNKCIKGTLVDIFVCILLPIIGEKKQMYKRDYSRHIWKQWKVYVCVHCCQWVKRRNQYIFFWQIFGLTGILHCHFIWFRVPWDSQVGGQNVKLKTVQQPGISHWHWKWIWFMSIFKNILLAVILLSWDRVHYGDNILSKHHPLLCLRYKCQHIWKDMLLLFKRGGLQLKAISSNRGCKVFSLGGGSWNF